MEGSLTHSQTSTWWKDMIGTNHNSLCLVNWFSANLIRKVRKVAIQKMVVDLMELYLHRLKQRRPLYPKSPAMAEFAALFPYEPTPDQKRVTLY